MLISTAEFANGLHLEVDGEIWTIIFFQHHKPGKGGAMMRTRLKNLATGAIIERTFRAGEKVEQVSIERQKKQFLYKSGDSYYFMDLQTYEQTGVDKAIIGEKANWLKETLEADFLICKGKIIGVELPINVELKVTYTEPGVKGDTVSSTTKPATLETGARINVPLFIKTGDLIIVDTRSGKYIQRK